MDKAARHAIDRLRERTRLSDTLVPELDAAVHGVSAPPGRYHLPLYAKDGGLKGWAAYKTVEPNGKLVLATILGPEMLPRGSADLRPYLRGTPAMTIREKLALFAKGAGQGSADADGNGEISPTELHEHFDADHDGKVDMKDYAKHINLHMAHPEWLAQETAELVAENEGVPPKEKKAGMARALSSPETRKNILKNVARGDKGALGIWDRISAHEMGRSGERALGRELRQTAEALKAYPKTAAFSALARRLQSQSR